MVSGVYVVGPKAIATLCEPTMPRINLDSRHRLVLGAPTMLSYNHTSYVRLELESSRGGRLLRIAPTSLTLSVCSKDTVGSQSFWPQDVLYTLVSFPPYGDGFFSFFFFSASYSSLVAFAGACCSGLTPLATMIRLISAMVSGAGLKLPTRCPCAISKGVQP